jgi:hypothetical protein
MLYMAAPTASTLLAFGLAVYQQYFGIASGHEVSYMRLTLKLRSVS